MNSALTIFNFKSTPVRTQLMDRNIWFCLIDVCDSLNLRRGSKVVDRLEEAGVRKTSLGVQTGIKSDGTPAFQKVETTFINEPNLYRLIFRSNKPQAQAFADWVYSEVLPSIRKTGGYGMSTLDAKAIGGIVKKCCAVTIREEIAAILNKTSENPESWEITNSHLLQVLQNWHYTQGKTEFEKMRNLIRENEELKRRLAAIKKAVA